jgi:hypothetical protein
VVVVAQFGVVVAQLWGCGGSVAGVVVTQLVRVVVAQLRGCGGSVG